MCYILYVARANEFECNDVFGYKVICTKQRWKHICKHVEIANLQNPIISIIAKPDFVNRSRSYANRFTFYKWVYISNLGKAETYIRVVIEYNIDESYTWYGRVISAMACDGPQLGEVTIWKGRAI